MKHLNDIRLHATRRAELLLTLTLDYSAALDRLRGMPMGALMRRDIEARLRDAYSSHGRDAVKRRIDTALRYGIAPDFLAIY